MTRLEIIQQLKKFFEVKELVCDHTYQRWGEHSWQFLDTDFLCCLLVIRRDILGVSMNCNSAGAHQKGLRCNRCDLVKNKPSVYLSSHILGKAADFTSPAMTALEMREKIKANQDKLPCNIRMEKGVSWLHFDVLPQSGITDKVYEFSA